eukprot:CAMPEP_0184657094 /NCGR_PEP_ID=MMETSP0308-20130426/16973_1 /TAXON_ID=38269 /ORGANISM="Gloeochaete witrockiana, Strain SAG 46.84" /LENGTH=250 /DNA_ID=CAMNT_0027094501 /DNA_START=198 /DNA_END=951 /DNA_ORIENTATION=-
MKGFSAVDRVFHEAVVNNVMPELRVLAEVLNRLHSQQILLTFGDMQYKELFDNFLCSAKRNGVTSLVVFSTDLEFYEYCVSVHSACIHYAMLLQNPTIPFPRYPITKFKNVGRQKPLMLHRLEVISIILSLGYEVLLIDVDVVLKENPLSLFRTSLSLKENPTWDFAFMDETGNLEEVGKAINAGCMYFRRTPAVAHFLTFWAESFKQRISVSDDQQELCDLLCVPYENEINPVSDTVVGEVGGVQLLER